MFVSSNVGFLTFSLGLGLNLVFGVGAVLVGLGAGFFCWSIFNSCVFVGVDDVGSGTGGGSFTKFAFFRAQTTS
jgi:hypothetical protein